MFVEFRTPAPGKLRFSCALCDKKSTTPFKHILVGSILNQARSIRRFKKVLFHEGDRFCCDHLVDHSDCGSSVSPPFKPAEGAHSRLTLVDGFHRKSRSPRIQTTNPTPFLSPVPSSLSSNLSFVSAKSHISDDDSTFVSSSLGTSSSPEASTDGSSISDVPSPYLDRRRLNADIATGSPSQRIETHRRQAVASYQHTLKQEKATVRSLKAEISDLKHQLDNEKHAREADIAAKDAHSASLLRKITADPNNSILRLTLSRIEKCCIGVSVDVSLSEDHKKSLKYVKHWTGVEHLPKLLADVMKKVVYTNFGRKPAYTKREWLIVYLIKAKKGLTLVDIVHWADLAETTVREHLNESEETFAIWAQDFIRLPTIPEWRQHSPSDLLEKYPLKLFFFLDGTFIPIFKPTNGEVQKECWQGKHKCHALVFTIVVMGDGRIVYVTDCDLGNMHDSTAWATSDGPQKLADKYKDIATNPSRSKISPQLVLCGDQAYSRAVIPSGWIAMTTMSGSDKTPEDIEDVNPEEEDEELSPEEEIAQHAALLTRNSSHLIRTQAFAKASDQQQDADKHIARWRSVVERTFALVKAFMALSNRYITSRSVYSVQNLIKIICAVVNHNMEQGITENEDEE